MQWGSVLWSVSPRSAVHLKDVVPPVACPDDNDDDDDEDDVCVASTKD